MGNPEKPLCFVIGPYGERGSKTRQWSDFLFNKVIAPVLADRYQVQRTIDNPEAGQISSRIKRDLDSAAVVIADLTADNPNVYYELGYRHATGRPFIHIVRADHPKLPFDVQDFDVVDVQANYVELAEQSQSYYTIRDEDLERAQKHLCKNLGNLPRIKDPRPFAAKVYSWDVYYSPRIAIDWLATQPEDIRSQICAYESGAGADDMAEESLTLLAEYLALKRAAALNGEGTIFMVMNNQTNHLDLGYAVFRFSCQAKPILINVKDVSCYGDGVASITFAQESQPFPLERGGRTIDVLIPGYKYTLPVSISEEDGRAKGVIVHPKTKTTIGDAELCPRFGMR